MKYPQWSPTLSDRIVWLMVTVTVCADFHSGYPRLSSSNKPSYSAKKHSLNVLIFYPPLHLYIILFDLLRNRKIYRTPFFNPGIKLDVFGSPESSGVSHILEKNVKAPLNPHSLGQECSVLTSSAPVLNKITSSCLLSTMTLPHSVFKIH